MIILDITRLTGLLIHKKYSRTVQRPSMIKHSTAAASALLFLFLSLSSPYTIACHAQGPMPADIAGDMLSLGAFSNPLNTSDTKTEKDVIRTALNVRPSEVQIQVGSQYGAGTIFSIDENRILILTAKHVIAKWDDAGSNYVIFFNGKVADAKLEVSDPYYDAAVISVETSLLEPYNLINLRKADFDFQNFSDFDKKKDETVIALDSKHIVNAKELQPYDYYGTESGIAGKYVYGSVISPNIMVTDYGYKMIYMKLAAHSGMSGGGIFDLRGNLVGILIGGSENGNIVAVRLADIKDLLSDIEAASSDELSGE